MSDPLRDGLDEFYKQMHAPRRATGRAGRRSNKLPAKLSFALKVHPSQVAEAEEHARRIGVPTQYAPNGMPLIRDRGHQRRFLKEHGKYARDHGMIPLVNTDGGYGD